MMKLLPRAAFHRPRLVRLLADLVPTDVPEPAASPAERLGSWLDLGDAIALSGALANPAAPAAATPPALDAVAEAADAARQALAAAIDGELTGGAPGRARVRLPLPAEETTREAAADFLPYRRYYVAHQRDMEAAVGPLRTAARAARAAASPDGARLAALDALFERSLAERERTLLAAVPFHLEQHYQRLRQRPAAESDGPAQWLAAGGWLATFRRDLRQVLHAELELRLLPVAGLLDRAADGPFADGPLFS